MITVIDYGAGNLRSVENTLKYLNVPHHITSQPEEVAAASAILLPGVGHFGQMVRSLDSLGLTPVVRTAIQGGVPYLGICLGMQALFAHSEEAPECEGLGIFSGTIRRFPQPMPQGLKVPHMGWNQVRVQGSSRLFAGIAANSFFYFAHSYYLPVEGGLRESSASPNASGIAQETAPAPRIAALADYAFPFVTAIETGSVFGVQFHPEKSGDVGVRVVSNFAAFAGEARSGDRAR
jgi:imidazole glycerol phosphate synthase glutamine amidotransferase subunit